MRFFITSVSILWIAHLTAQTSFPLKVSENKRFLEDSNQTPFYYQADTAWHLFFDLRPAEAEHYIVTRLEQGFNTLQIMLTGAKDQVDLNGESPWLGNHDFARPNEVFFARVDSILALTRKHNLYVAIVPLWAGCCREDMAGNDRDGNPLPMNVNGPMKTYEFGKWIGNRYGTYNNIMWVIGGDNDPYGAYGEYQALVRGLKETTENQLFTYHAASTHSSTDVYPIADWLDVSMVYTYFRGFNKAWNRIQPDVYEVAYDEYRKGKMPFFLGESNYEREHDGWGSPTQVRKQAYWCMLSGGTGHAYGSVNWKIPENWKDMLLLPGAVSFRHMASLVKLVDFHTLSPDWSGRFLKDGAGQYASNDYAIAAFTQHQKGAVVYIPSGRKLTLNLKQLNAVQASLCWFDPRTGRTTQVGTFKNTAMLTTPTNEDWVLLANVEGH